MKKHGFNRQVDMGILMALVLLCVFAVCITVTIMYGANIYDRLISDNNAAAESRTAVQYLITRVRQADEIGSMKVENDMGQQSENASDDSENMNAVDGNILVLHSSEEDPDDPSVIYEYCTRIYCFDGYLRELFTEVSDDSYDLDPEAGEKVLFAEGVDFSIEDGMLKAEIRTGDTVQTLELELRCGEVA